MFELRPLQPDSVPRALEKAERYRLLNEPREAESICRDILRADASNEAAIVIMLLALTDQFGMGVRVSVNHARELIDRMSDPYHQAYYEGILSERWGKHLMEEGAPGYTVFDWFTAAMKCFARAIELAPDGNEDAVLRWNTCARMIKRHDLRPRPEEGVEEAEYFDEVPRR